MTDDEIIAACSSAGNNESDCEFVNEIGAPSKEIMTRVEAMMQLDKLMVYLECQAETTPAELMLVKCLRNRVARKRCTNVKQKINLPTISVHKTGLNVRKVLCIFENKVSIKTFLYTELQKKWNAYIFCKNCN